MAVIYLVRHGQASFDKSDYDELSPLGVEQSEVLGRSLATRIERVDRVVVGGLQRHRQTARHALTAMRLPVHWDEDPQWSEYDHREIIERCNPLYRSRTVMMATMARTLKPREAFQRFFDKALRRWISGKYDAQYREPWPAFKQRVGEGLESIRGSGKKTTLVFTSGGAISASVRQLWNLPDAQWPGLNSLIANATVTKVIVGRRGLHLSTFNEHGHFEGAAQGRLLTYR